MKYASTLAFLLCLTACGDDAATGPASGPSSTSSTSGGDGGAAPAGDLVVRVDQVGYATNEPKRAMVLAKGAHAGAAFEVVDTTGAVAASGDLGADRGAWNDTFDHVYPIDFDVSKPGDYRVRVLGVESSVVHVAPAAELYAPLLDDVAFFFRVQRDGEDVDPTALDRKASHLDDAQAKIYEAPVYSGDKLAEDLAPTGETRDVEGGWFDAGDYIKFVQTTSYVEAVLLVTLRDHPAAAAAAGLDVEARRGVAWLEKMWDDDARTLYYQVGIGDGNAHIRGDHDSWRLPEDDDALDVQPGDARYFVRYRPVFRAADPGAKISPNLAGRVAADFALCAQVYRASDAALADRCLQSAAHVLALADDAPSGLRSVSPHDYYPESTWRDDLELGAVELHRAILAAPSPPNDAESATAYLKDAARWADAYMTHESGGDSLNLYDVGALAHRELANAIVAAHEPGGLEVGLADIRGDLRDQLTAARDQASSDPFGLGVAYGQADATPHAFGLALTESFYEEIGGDDAFAQLGRDNRAWIFGANAWGATFVVGAGDAFPRCVHHQIANIAGSLDGAGDVLRGAAVDGPSSPSNFKGLGFEDDQRRCGPGHDDAFAPFATHRARYLDESDAWPSVEPAIDYSVLAVLYYARRISAD